MMKCTEDEEQAEREASLVPEAGLPLNNQLKYVFMVALNVLVNLLKILECSNTEKCTSQVIE